MLTVTPVEQDAVFPSVSVTVNVTLKLLKHGGAGSHTAAVNVCVGVAPNPDVPSPKSHVRVAMPAAAELPVASNATTKGEEPIGGSGFVVNVQTGAELSTVTEV